ncbi:unnamed protein product [Soboliphyme baturini]|uniref:Trafficking protein particle complex subunit 6B n=1 Tax=Soboliphyme baturini TaxID=241478 RepID=A0A183IDZ5_9BILA|nr:unnamed protein product [Soboliphyme baturini]
MEVQYPFEYLHLEMVSSLCQMTSESTTDSAIKVGALTKLERIGYRVGMALCESLLREHQRLMSEVEVMKFICKEFWETIFLKQVDSLKTDHQGTYIISDTRFWLVSSLSNTEQYREESPYYLAFSCGLIRGALKTLNFVAVATAEVCIMPSVKFSVTLHSSPSFSK